MRLGSTRALTRALPLLLSVVLLVALAPLAGHRPASAADATTLALAGEPRPAGQSSPLVATLTASDGAAVPGAQVVVERRVDGAWTSAGTATTDVSGRAQVSAVIGRDADDNVFRASYAGDGTRGPSRSADVQVPLVRVGTRVRVTGPRTVVDERPLDLTVRWTTEAGEPVSGPVVVLRRKVDGPWRPVERLTTDAAGAATFTTEPRVDTRWKARTRPLPWAERDRSRVHRVDNLPPAPPADLPDAAPRPRIQLPPQRRAVGEGANPVISRIPDQVWRDMTGRLWHAGCPVGRAGLRLLRINYWDYDGYRRRGEIVAAAGAVGAMAGALAAMYERELPIRAMYRVDRFGWSPRLQGADDHASMASGNTSAFNCRQVVNNPGVRSPHSYGRSLDVNTWENPYRSATGLVPNAWWQPRSHPRVAWRSRAHAVVRIMARHGLRWTYGHGDTQHFDVVRSNGKVLFPRGCSILVPCK
ncbi:M15 family metallopeptidase [Nocardioides sp.]|uniref:M15 family metallopeptidase n=1 Tax=Nocardioides sp. TaxID=35761 RepID=UPI001A28FF6E|nr:M15 family metallopeptidase [Nocardioides sp.]MBJ7356164.1 M15 family metallopeptidase [Nocardioides sp.]